MFQSCQKLRRGFLRMVLFLCAGRMSHLAASALVLNQLVDLLKARLGEIPNHHIGAVS